MRKTDTSLEELIRGRDQGWRFALKKVKGKQYIIKRRNRKERSLGPYNEQLWSLIKDVVGVDTGEDVARGQKSKLAPTGIADAAAAVKILKTVRLLGFEPDDVSVVIEAVYKKIIEKDLEPETFVKIVKGLHEMNVESGEDYDALEKQIEYMKSQAKILEERSIELSNLNAAAESSLAKSNSILVEKAELVSRVREAETLRISPMELGVIVEAVRRAGARNGLEVKESIEVFTKDIEEVWEPAQGFRNELASLESRLSQTKNKLDLAEEMQKTTLERVRAHEEELGDLAKLRKVVSPAELVDFKGILLESGQDIPTFRAELRRLGGVTSKVNQVITERRTELESLEDQSLKLKAQVARFTNQRDSLQAMIEALSSDALKSVEESATAIKGVADSLHADFNSPDTGYKAQIKKCSDEIYKETRDEFAKRRGAIIDGINQLDAFMKKSVEDVEKLREDSWETGRLIGHYVQLSNLVNLISGRPIAVTEALVTMSWAVGSFNDYLLRNNLAAGCPSASRLITEIRSLVY